MPHQVLCTKVTTAWAAIVGLIVLLGMRPIPALGCEPLPPLLVLFVVPSLTSGPVMGWLGVVVGLAVGVGLKCTAFAYFEPALPPWRALRVMLLANVVTTGIGIFVAIAHTLPAFLVLLPLVYALMRAPMPRLASWVGRRWVGPHTLAAAGLLLFLASYLLFYRARAQLALGGSTLRYWGLKLAYVYPALTVGVGLTTLWEEWLVSRWIWGKDAPPACYGSVLRANLVMLLLLIGVAAAAVLPKRLAAPGFLWSW
jgi:hypothetical protein